MKCSLTIAVDKTNHPVCLFIMYLRPVMPEESEDEFSWSLRSSPTLFHLFKLAIPLRKSEYPFAQYPREQNISPSEKKLFIVDSVVPIRIRA